MLNELQNWSMSELVLLWVPMVHVLSSIPWWHNYNGWIDSRFTSVHECVLVITQGFTRKGEQDFWIWLID